MLAGGKHNVLRKTCKNNVPPALIPTISSSATILLVVVVGTDTSVTNKPCGDKEEEEGIFMIMLFDSIRSSR